MTHSGLGAGVRCEPLLENSICAKGTHAVCQLVMNIEGFPFAEED